jgi:hypothetical protein
MKKTIEELVHGSWSGCSTLLVRMDNTVAGRNYSKFYLRMGHEFWMNLEHKSRHMSGVNPENALKIYKVSGEDIVKLMCAPVVDDELVQRLILECVYVAPKPYLFKTEQGSSVVVCGSREEVFVGAERLSKEEVEFIYNRLQK